MNDSSFQPEKFIKFSEDLISNTDLEEEPLFRTVVNRCYLAAYVCTKHFLSSKDYRYSSNYEDYKQVEHDLRDAFGRKKGRMLQEKLSLLRDSRRAVDYEYPFRHHLDRWFVDHKISLAKNILSELQD